MDTDFTDGYGWTRIPSRWPPGDIVGWAASPDRPGDANFLPSAAAFAVQRPPLLFARLPQPQVAAQPPNPLGHSACAGGPAHQVRLRQPQNIGG
ncbi:MAG: hypothetical protein LIO90_09260 [Bacteroidales bacterium]|nr:hypothetical protein [Bacteroidales bacterium]